MVRCRHHEEDCAIDSLNTKPIGQNFEPNHLRIINLKREPAEPDESHERRRRNQANLHKMLDDPC